MISTEIIPAKIEPIPGVPVRRPHIKNAEAKMQNGAQKIDGRQLWVPVTAVGVIIAFLAAVVWEARGWKAALDDNTRAIEDLKNTMRDTWTSRDMREWASMLRSLNPEIRIPDPIHR